MKPYHFSLLRYMHSATAGELVNIGVVMWIPIDRKILTWINEKYARLSGFYSTEFDGSEYRRMVRDLRARFERVAAPQTAEAQNFAQVVDMLLAPNSSCFQWSAPMGGMSADPEARFSALVDEFVERYNRGVRPRRDEAEIWADVQSKLKEREVLGRVQTNVEVHGAHLSYNFRLGWLNGAKHFLEPISFDYLSAKDVIEKANAWTGRLYDFRDSGIRFHGVLAKPTRDDFLEVFEQARRTLASAPTVEELVLESDVDRLLARIDGEAH